MPDLPRFWLEDRWPSRVLWPLAACFSGAVRLRAAAYRNGWRRRYRVGVPVIVVGNLFVGGTGKTPMVIWLVERLSAYGYRAGVISRGYGGDIGGPPRFVEAHDDPARVGDEPVLIAARTRAPVAVGVDRVAAAQRLVREGGCEVVVSDDGLQHYRLERDAEVAVFDAVRGVGNGRCFPAGPLREPLSRLQRVDLVLGNGGSFDHGGYAFRLVPGRLTALGGGSSAIAPRPSGTRVRAIAGIAHPERFFRLLQMLGYCVVPQPFPDHHAFRRKDLEYADALPIIMTEKDAVKCRRIAGSGSWYLPVTAEPDGRTQIALDSMLRRLVPQAGIDRP